MSQAAGQSLVRRSASAPAVAEHHGAAEEGAVGPEQELHQRGDLLGAARSPDRDGEHVEQGAGLGSARMLVIIGVSIMPGAIALSRSPAPAQSGPVAWRRTQWATASLVAG